MEEQTEELLERLRDQIAATEELPIAREANAWLGEAQAVAADAARGGSPAVIADRVRQVRKLLERIEATEHPEADERVDDALATASEIERRLEGSTE